MKINLNKEDLNRVRKLIDIKESNIVLSELLNDLCQIKDKQVSTYFEKNLKDDNVYALISNLYNLDEENDNELINHLNQTKIEYIDNEKYTDNEYYSLIKSASFNDKHYSLVYDLYPKYCFIPLDDCDVDSLNYKETYHIGLFKDDFKTLALKKDDEIWMSIIPCETKTIQKDIDNASGNVLTYGLGLGYYAFMVSNKEDVKSMTVVEYDQNVIDIFNKYLLPLFPNKNKIKIIHQDAFEHFKNIKKNEYDYCFIDIWHTANDGSFDYVKFKKIENGNVKTTYWLETSLLAFLRRCLLAIIEESLENVDPSIYKKAKNKEDELINNLYELTKDIELTSYQQVIDLLSDNSIKKILKLQSA